MKINSRKYRHKAAAAAITVGVIAALLILNVVFTLLSGRFLLYIDVTREKYNEISDESRTLLDELDPKENDITIYFLADKDELDNPSLGYLKTGSTTDLWGMRYVYELAQQYALSYGFIKVGFLSLKNDTDKLAEYKTTVGSKFGKTTVIVDNYTGEVDEKGDPVYGENGVQLHHHNYRIIERDAFFRANSDTMYAYAFDGDYRFTSVLLSLSGKNPTVYFIGGHGEPIGALDDLSDFGEAAALRDVFFDAGFVTRKLDLENDYMRAFDDESARVLIVFGPKEDYSAKETDLLHRFACRVNHNLMFFVDDVPSGLANLKEYISDYCGVSFLPSTVKDIGSGGLSGDGDAFIAAYETDEYSIGLSLLKTLNELDSQPAVAFESVSPLVISEHYVQTPSNASSGFSENAASTITGGMFRAPSTAVAEDAEGNTVSDYSESPADVVMTLTHESWMNSNNGSDDTYTLICGSTGFAKSEYLNDPVYGNRDVLTLAMRLMGKEIIPFEIDFKVIQSEAVDIEDSEARAWTVVFCTVIPVAALAMGTVVYFRRRHQ